MDQKHGGKPTLPAATIRLLVKKSFGQKFTQMTAQYWLIAGILLCGMGLELFRTEVVKRWRESDDGRPNWVNVNLPDPMAGDESVGCNQGELRKCGQGVGECRFGTQTCTLGRWDTCVGAVHPSQEQCDGIDSNCNGRTDYEDGCSCLVGQTRNCGTNIGECTFGTQTCTIQGLWGKCIGGRAPSPLGEICGNHVDDDCNGVIDDEDRCPPPAMKTW